MDRTLLSVELVEAVQILANKAKPVGDLVASLQSATLPGIVEYGCLKFSNPAAIPPLPDRIIAGTICQALDKVPSALGVRTNGPGKRSIKSVTPRPIEFHVFGNEADLEDPEWGRFCDRFEASAKQVGFSRDAAIHLNSALREMAENAVIHAQMPIPALCGFQVVNEAALFTVADVGIGVLASLQSAPQYRHLATSIEAIDLALRAGVTSRPFENGGLGFNSVFKALAEQWGQLRFRSGNGSITMDGTHLDADKSKRTFPPSLPGFQVSVCCRAHESALTKSFF